MEACCLWESGFTRDPMEMAFKCGAREIGLMIHGDVASVPGGLDSLAQDERLERAQGEKNG